MLTLNISLTSWLWLLIYHTFSTSGTILLTPSMKLMWGKCYDQGLCNQALVIAMSFTKSTHTHTYIIYIFKFFCLILWYTNHFYVLISLLWLNQGTILQRRISFELRKPHFLYGLWLILHATKLNNWNMQIVLLMKDSRSSIPLIGVFSIAILNTMLSQHCVKENEGQNTYIF